MNKHILLYLLLAFVASTFIFSSCSRDDIAEGTGLQFSTSRDTILFDTVFTETGSVTRSFKIYNENNEPATIDIRLVGGTDSPFRINADGFTGPEINDAVIQANDSMYVFAEVTIDPDQPLSISPFIVEDQVIVNEGSNQKIVQLEAFGQNANYLTRKNSDVFTPCTGAGEIVWDDPKPYIIYGQMQVADCQLVLPAGCRVYVHGGLNFVDDTTIVNSGSIYVLGNGSIDARGTADQPVSIQGDRLEVEYADVPGQWFGLVFLGGSSNNKLKHTIIKNAIYSALVDSTSHIDIENSQLINSSSIGLYGRHASTNITNSLIYSAGSYGVYWQEGGNYNMQYTTVASYYVQAEALRMQNYFCTDPLCLGQIRTNTLNVNISNSILAGSARDEILIDRVDDGSGNGINYSINNTILKIDELLEREANFFDQCTECINYSNSDTLFVDINENNYELDSLSIATLKAKAIFGINDDLLGRMRSAVPDIGCYESQFK